MAGCLKRGKQMIPKKIHYCWFGGNPLPELAKKCIASWKKYCPDYEIVEWNESNFDVSHWDYTREAYEAKKWAFVSDVARLYALVNFGGVYMDTDVEVLKPLDDILAYDAVSGFETGNQIPTGLMACCANHPLFEELLEEYNDAHFIKQDGTFDMTTNVVRITNVCLKYGLRLDNTLQTVNGFTLFPCDYFCPKDYRTKAITLTQNTMTIHHFDGSWLSEEDKYRAVLLEKYSKKMPSLAARYFSKYQATKKYRGIKAALCMPISWFKERNR